MWWTTKINQPHTFWLVRLNCTIKVVTIAWNGKQRRRRRHPKIKCFAQNSKTKGNSMRSNGSNRRMIVIKLPNELEREINRNYQSIRIISNSYKVFLRSTISYENILFTWTFVDVGWQLSAICGYNWIKKLLKLACFLYVNVAFLLHV